MTAEKYELESSTTNMTFRFISLGHKNIQKIIEYDLISDPESYGLPNEVELYNLGFGDILNNPETNEEYVSDSSRSNNGDKFKVLNTVASTILIFFEKNPNAFIYVEGSTPSRNREYRIGIGKIYNELNQKFDIAGLIEDCEAIYWEDYEPNKNYKAFLMKKK